MNTIKRLRALFNQESSMTKARQQTAMDQTLAILGPRSPWNAARWDAYYQVALAEELDPK